MTQARALLLILAMYWLVLGHALAEDRECLRCHSMKGMAYQDPVTGGLRALSIDPAALAASSHAKLTCRTCHGPGFEIYPHLEGAKQERLHCLECHKGNDHFPYARFEAIEKGFVRSVHARAMEQFTCFSCHDPHVFHGLFQRPVADVPAQVQQDNAICRQCHGESERIKALTGRIFPNLLQSHAWLPEVERHWQGVRCVECHTGSSRARDHFILGKEFALRDCVSCHSRNSLLLGKLYLYQASEERQKVGFVNALVLNNAYVIGMTRNLWLDWAGLAILGLAAVTLLGHGLARWLLARPGSHHEAEHPRSGEGVELYPVWLRIWHWSNALSFIILIVSGVSLHFAGSTVPLLPFNTARVLHNVFGLLLTFAYGVYALATLFGRNGIHYRPRLAGLPGRLLRQAMFYGVGIFRGEPHPFPATARCKFNPLQQVTYLGVMFVFVPLLILSGLLFFFPEWAPEQFLEMDGLWVVGVAHFLLGLLLTAFMLGHLYLATAGETLLGEFRKMIFGARAGEE
ncbi:MAG: cytochrome b/b6 domain-containing protein [Magnetococcus sp. YQC-3]